MLNHRVSLLVVACAVMFPALSSLGSDLMGQEVELRVSSNGATCAVKLPDGRTIHTTAATIREAHLLRITGHDTVVACWREQDACGDEQVLYSVSFDGKRFSKARQAHTTLRLRYAPFDPMEYVPTVAPMFAADTQQRLHIVQFTTQPLDAYRERIESAGGTICRYLPDSAYIVEMDINCADEVAQLPFVRWVGPYHPAYKLDDVLLGSVAFADVERASRRYRIQVMQRGLDQKSAVAKRIADMGGTIDALTPNGFLLEATLTPAQLLAVAQMDEVLFVDRWAQPRTYMDIVRESTGANMLESVAGFTGQGVRAEVMDNYLYNNHIAFQTPPPILHGTQTEFLPPNNHGTAVYGCLFSNGSEDPNSRGMIPDAQGIFADFDHLVDRYAHTAELLQPPYEAVLQSNSWGTARSRAYTNKSAEMDDILFTHDVLILQAQANEGEQESDEAAWAKNIVSVGGIRHENTLDRSDDHWGGGGAPASIGPAEDGRIKPDLCHFNDYIRAPLPLIYISTFGGTSSSTPIVAGHFGIFFQMWHEALFGNNASGDTVFGNRPHMSTAKAMMINTAWQYPFEGEDHDLTRVHQGWGLPDLEQLYAMRDSMLIVDETDLISNLQSNRYEVTVPNALQPLRVTLVYTDPQGTVGAEVHRINDLTIKVTSPSRVAYFGNHGLTEGNWSLPGGDEDTINTVENVYVKEPEAGVWTIDVFASEINQDAHLETTEVDADYALVVSGIVVKLPGDCDLDGAITLDDYTTMAECWSGPDGDAAVSTCSCADLDMDDDVDLADFATFQRLLD